MSKKSELNKDEQFLREKAEQTLRKNITPSYSSDDEGGLVSGSVTKEEMIKQTKEDDKN